MPGTKRHRVLVDQSALAQQMGERLKAARNRQGLTQQQLAEGRYTKAYVSALEKGLARPSMGALTFFAERLGLPPGYFLGDAMPAWSRLEADLALASGRWQDAVDAYEGLLPGAADTGSRAELLRGLAEALCRLDQGTRAIALATEAADLFRKLGREADAAIAMYWVSNGQYQAENDTEAVSILRGLLERVRGGLQVSPDFELRLLVAVAANHARNEENDKALSYLEEARGLVTDLDDRRRAAFYGALAYSYRRAGDLEAAMRAGREALALFHATDSEREVANLEQELALTYNALSNQERAQEYVTAARQRAERLGEERLLAHIADSEARIALAGGDAKQALALADEAIRLADATSNVKAKVDALVTRAQALEASGDGEGSARAFDQAADIVRERGPAGRLREVLGEWAASLARQGEHERAYALTREALANRS
jgi:transcriptional regulator with XRE-family HTH domain